MDQNVAALVPLLPGYFGWNLSRTKCLAGLIIAFDQGQNRQFRAISHRSSRWRLEGPEV